MKGNNRALVLIAATAAVLFLAAAAPLTAASKEQFVDMTFPFSEDSIYWPTDKPFTPKTVFKGFSDAGWWYASNEYAASEHGGTHADAPVHFSEKGRTIGQIPLREWIGPAVRINVTKKCSANRDYLLSVDDIRAWEKAHGRIPKGAWVIMHSGLDDKSYPNKKEVLGTEKTGKEAIAELHFPGFSPEAAEFLLDNRNITGIAVDTPSIDPGMSKDFKVHQVLCKAQKLALENIANLDKIPESGATLFVIPMLIQNGTGSPARVFAKLP
ncbi:MAG: cyclase family protein [Desulfobacteraceae bacterium]|nr:cyclase family protein [Desulfobacteraceae bacterium]